MTDHDQKELFKQAIKEWMDEQSAKIGRWTIKTLATIAITGLLFAYFKFGGFKFP